MPSELMLSRCAEVLAAFDTPQIHRGHLAAWGVHRTGKRDAYITAFKEAFGSNKSTLTWTIEPVANGFTATPNKGTALRHVVQREAVEASRRLLNGEKLPKAPIESFRTLPTTVRGDVPGMVAEIDRVRDPNGSFVFYGQELNPGRLLKIGKIARNALGAELYWWLSRHSWIFRDPNGKSELLWAIPVASSEAAQDMEVAFCRRFADFGYEIKSGVRHGRESFHLQGDVRDIGSELQDRSDPLLMTSRVSVNNSFYPLSF